MATRTLDLVHAAALGIEVTFDSTYALNDQFHVTANLDGDARNILEPKLQNGDGSAGASVRFSPASCLALARSCNPRSSMACEGSL